MTRTQRGVRTKTGYVHVQDSMVILEGSITGLIENVWNGLTRTDTPFRAFAVLTIFGTVMLSLVVAALESPPMLGTAITIALLAVALASREDTKQKNLTDVSEIDVESIQNVSAESGVFGLIRPRLLIEFEDDGEIVRRYVLLPHGLFTGEDHLGNAIDYFESNGIDVA